MLQTAFSSYWILLCLLLGGIYAFILYSKKKYPWPKTWNWLLAAFRFLTVSILAYLFLEPYIVKKETLFTPAKLVFLWDDTESVSMALDSVTIQESWNKLHQLAEEVAAEKDLTLVWETVSEQERTADKLLNNLAGVSPLHAALQRIKTQNSDDALQEVVLVSDGIFNLGPSPDYFNYPYRISTVGLGDSSIQKDLAIKKLRYNKVAYEGNKFPIDVLLTKSGYGALTTKLSLQLAGKTISKEVVFKASETVQELTFLIDANQKGYQSYQFSLQKQADERNFNNNRQSAYVNIIEGKKKIVLLAAAPHPDINSIKLALDGNDNYELSLAIPGVYPYKAEDYDMAILFHLPDDKQTFAKEIEVLRNKKCPLWFVAGANLSSLGPASFNSYNQSVRLPNNAQLSELDLATVHMNSDFTPFDMLGQEEAVLSTYPPIAMPYMEPEISPLAEVLLFKQIGKVKTQQPIASFFEDGTDKQATTFLEGFWRWRLHEFRQTGSFTIFDDWITKTVRWLTTVSTKNQFDIYPRTERFAAFEPVIMSVESYDEVYEPVYGNEIDLQIANADTLLTFDFKTVNLDTDFNLGSLPAASYTYEAKTMIGGKSFSKKGQFLVEENNIESLNLQADYGVLKRLSKNNEGGFYTIDDLENLKLDLLAKDFTKTIAGTQENSPLIEQYLLFFTLLALLITEWFMRRYYGSY